MAVGPKLRVEWTSELDTVTSEWRELAERVGNVFATPEWLTIWWKHFGRGEPALGICRDAEGRLVALLPLYLWRTRPLRIARFLGHGPGDELGPLCEAADRDAATAAMGSALGELGAHVLVGEQLPGPARWGERLGGRVLSTEGSPVLPITGTWDDYLRSKSSNFREQVRRRERKLDREHGVRYRRTEDAPALDADLDALFALHGARWHAGGSSFVGAPERFHREFAHRAFERGWLRLWFLEAGGDTAAAWYGLRFAGADSYYQAGRDPQWERMSVGFILLAHSIREAMQDGMREYRFLRGGEEFKYRFAEDDPGLETIGVARGPLGSAALAAVAAAPRALVRRIG